MSVIVKGMQMPKACMLCPIYDGEYGECGVLHDRDLFPFLSEDTYRYDATKERHKDCPLVERPQGEWIVKVERYGCYVGDRTVYSYTCPFCGRKEFGTYPFCHCGAELRGEEK